MPGIDLLDAPAFFATPFFVAAFFDVAPLAAEDFAFAFFCAAPGTLAVTFAVTSAAAVSFAIKNLERSLT